MATHDNDIDVLNDLIETTIDSADGYEQAAETASETDGVGDLAELFRRFANERHAIVTDLRSQVVLLGGEPEEDGSLLAGAHRSFLKLKSLFGSGRQRIIEEVEAGEDVIKAKYKSALQKDLSANTRAVIEKANVSVLAGHDTMSAMKHAHD
ncbi:PA2169 family four-helix-bundle protein [Polymorphobacter sp.]|uniref:PA2169 family four-helix-bundle protein n=1 Tax=Polymorphobacter sp. TaxID=1909290 RepID=UPI003F725AA2